MLHFLRWSRKRRVPVLGMALAFVFGGCEHSGGSGDDFSEGDFSGFVRVASSGERVVLGTDLVTANVKERTKMPVQFDYDFQIQKHEVTCGEFKSLMKVSTKCENDSVAMTDVSYYDAVLFANEMSKREKRDTSYSYVSVDLDDDGFCIGMEGLSFHPEVEGFRLPTEAEWVYAASMKWNVSNSWTADDQVSSAQKVCSKKNTTLCDMEGNVSEWVNDWLGLFREETVLNFMGALDGGSFGERVVKGGNFRKDSKSINSYSRGDVYTVTSATRAPYVGFRLAVGAIAGGNWLSSEGPVQERSVNPLASSSTLRKFSDAYRAKLVFRNDMTGNLAFVDYSFSSLPVVEFKDSLDVYHPEISPDGKWVAFCTGMEGISGKSSVYVRELKSNDGKIVKLNVESAAIPRWRVRGEGDTVIVYVSDAGDNKDGKSFLQKSTWEVPFSHGAFAEPKKILDGAYHGGVDGDFAVSGSKLLRAHKDGADTVWYDSAQACNVSLSKSHDKRVLFLDFGGEPGRKFVGESYDIHERILIADSNGALIQSVGAPAGYTFDHSEWAGEDLVVATLTNVNGRHMKIVAIRPSDSSMVELAEGDELWHPSLWTQKLNVEVDKSLELDSAAVYSDGTSATNYLQYKLPMFWNTMDSLEVIGLGNSRMATGFCAGMIEHSLNMATIPCDVHCSRYLFENYLLNHASRLKYLVVGVDLDLWMDDGDYALKTTFGTAPGYVYDRNHDFWRDGLPDGFAALSRSRDIAYESFRVTFDTYEGQHAIPENEGIGWRNEDGTSEILDRDWDLIWDNADGNYQDLLNIVKSAKKKGIYVIGVMFPMSPYYKETDQYGRHGLRRTTANKYLELLEKFDSEEEYFVLFNENKMGDHDYGSELAYDYDHLNYNGSKVLTGRLIELLKTLE